MYVYSAVSYCVYAGRLWADVALGGRSAYLRPSTGGQLGPAPSSCSRGEALIVAIARFIAGCSLILVATCTILDAPRDANRSSFLSSFSFSSMGNSSNGVFNGAAKTGCRSA